MGNVTAGATKRGGETQAARVGPKVPKANEVTVIELPKQATTTAQRQPGFAPVTVCIYKVTDEAGDVWSVYESQAGVQLWQVQICHDAHPSITFGIVNSFNDFLKQAHETDNALPTTLMDLRDVGINLIVSDKNDPDEVGFEQWRVAFYVAGTSEANSLQNFFFLLDDFFMYKEKAMAHEKPFVVHLHPHIGITIDDADLQYEHYVNNEATTKLPLGIFNAQPVSGKHVLTMHIQPESAKIMSIVLVGKSWAFRSRLDLHGVPGAYTGGEQEKRFYCRMMKSIDVSDGAQQDRVRSMIGDSVFKNMALRVVVDSELETDSKVAGFVQQLRTIPSLHFCD